jgi:hypothetical protein
MTTIVIAKADAGRPVAALLQARLRFLENLTALSQWPHSATRSQITWKANPGAGRRARGCSAQADGEAL